ncbi:phage tail assembly chaperone [Ancylobacter sp. VNQ12]|uniref:phage tail assembly chaperone n=1 Tax=Ancylobacter sp. VNQ12 TaxID=3400920 RepID=UPI003C016F5C
MVSLTVRYDTPDEKGETRRQRNIRFDEGEKNPDIEIPDGAEHILGWFWDLSSARSHGFSGPNPLSLSDIAAWSRLMGEIVSREEIAILRAMDTAFVAAITAEQSAQMERNRSRNG